MKIHIQERTSLRRKLRYFILIVCLFAFSACNKNIEKTEVKPVVQEPVEKEISLNIVTTDKLLYNMVKDIAGDMHSIDYMFTDKEKLWNFKFTEDSINNISRKDLFFYWGSGIEPWAPDFINKLTMNKVGAVSISRGVKLLELGKVLKYNETTLKDNPYFWMNVSYYKVAMLNIKNSIQDKDTKNRDLYEKSFSEAVARVEEYQKKINDSVSKLKEYTFIVDGDELVYFTEYYGLKTLKLNKNGSQPNEEETEENLKLEDKIKELKNVVFLFDEEGKLDLNREVINKYNLRTLHILLYKSDIKYTDILSNNLNSLESLETPK
jgi:ABC-type Zn uptake system ZnuABC Zn-binding protein ZnuA